MDPGPQEASQLPGTRLQPSSPSLGPSMSTNVTGHPLCLAHLVWEGHLASEMVRGLVGGALSPGHWQPPSTPMAPPRHPGFTEEAQAEGHPCSGSTEQQAGTEAPSWWVPEVVARTAGDGFQTWWSRPIHPSPSPGPRPPGLRLASLLPGVKWKSPRFFFCIHSSFDLKRNAGGSLPFLPVSLSWYPRSPHGAVGEASV